MENWEELVRESMRDYQPQVPGHCWETLSQQLDALHAVQGGASASEQGAEMASEAGTEVTSEAASGTASTTVNAVSEMSGVSGMAVNGGKIAGSLMGKAAAFFSGAAAKAALGVAVAGGLAFMGYRLLSGSDKEVEPAAQVVAATEKTMEQNDAEQIANQESAPTSEEDFSNTSFSEGIPYYLMEDPSAANDDKSVNQMVEAGVGTSAVPERDASPQNTALQQQPVTESADEASSRAVAAEKNASVTHTTAVPESKNEKKASAIAASSDIKTSSTAKNKGETNKTDVMDETSSPQPAISIPNVITPNGDNVNDYLEITGLEQLTETRLVIYNRGGKVVYEKRAYDNSWQAENLPEGVYYYWFSFEYEGKSLMRQGSIHVIR